MLPRLREPSFSTVPTSAAEEENLSAILRRRWCFGAPVPAQASRKSKEQDKRAGDHQRKHPNQINVEPCAAQYCYAKFFVN